MRLQLKVIDIRPLSLRKLALGVILFALSACGYNPTPGDQPSTEFGANNLHPVQHTGFDMAYVHPKAALPSYREAKIELLNLDNVEIPQTPVASSFRSNWQMTPERERTLQQAWAKAMQHSFADYQQSGSDSHALRISSEITRIAPGLPSATTIASAPQPRGITEYVEVLAEFRCYDQASGKLLLVIRDRGTIGARQWSRTEQTDMALLFKRWAGYLHTLVSKYDQGGEST